MIAKLETRSGGFVTWAVLLPFETAPDIIYWGSRTFMYDRASSEEESAARTPTFREAFATIALNTNAVGGLIHETDPAEIMAGIERHIIKSTPREYDPRAAAPVFDAPQPVRYDGKGGTAVRG